MLWGAALRAGYRAQVRGEAGRGLAAWGMELRPGGTAFKVTLFSWLASSSCHVLPDLDLCSFPDSLFCALAQFGRDLLIDIGLFADGADLSGHPFNHHSEAITLQSDGGRPLAGDALFADDTFHDFTDASRIHLIFS